MSGKADQFLAKDAFIYTDTYRKAIKMNASNIATEKEHLLERQRRSGAFDSHYYAELRGLEHAMSHIVKGQDPQRVILGELDGSNEDREAQEKAKLTGQIGRLQKEITDEKSTNEKLKKDLKKVGDAYTKLQTEVTELRQIAARLRRKVAQTSSTFGVVVFAMFIVIVVLLTVVNN